MMRKSAVKKGEFCALCNKEVPDGKLCIRHTTTEQMLCLICLIELAEIL